MWDTVASVALMPLALLMVSNGTAVVLAFYRWLVPESLSTIEEGGVGGGGDTYCKWWFEKHLSLNVTLRTVLFCYSEKEG